MPRSLANVRRWALLFVVTDRTGCELATGAHARSHAWRKSSVRSVSVAYRQRSGRLIPTGRWRSLRDGHPGPISNEAGVLVAACAGSLAGGLALCAAVITRTKFVADLSACPGALRVSRCCWTSCAVAPLPGWYCWASRGGAAGAGSAVPRTAAAAAQSPRFSSVQNGGAESQVMTCAIFRAALFAQPGGRPRPVQQRRLAGGSDPDQLDALSGDGGLLVKRALPRSDRREPADA